MKQTLALALGLLIVVAGQAGADDQTFVTKASAGGMAEVDHSRIAVKNSSNASVKKFAEQMIEDHTKANKELLALAAKKKYKPAPSMDDEHKKMAAKLAGLTGGAFDSAYMRGQVKDHVDAVALFEKEAKDGSDADLKKWAKMTLPHLKEHLKMAMDIHEKLPDPKTGGRKPGE